MTGGPKDRTGWPIREGARVDVTPGPVSNSGDVRPAPYVGVVDGFRPVPPDPKTKEPSPPIVLVRVGDIVRTAWPVHCKVKRARRVRVAAEARGD